MRIASYIFCHDCFVHYEKRDKDGHQTLILRDWSLIKGKGGGATQWENRGSETVCAPPQSFRDPLLKGGNFVHPSTSP